MFATPATPNLADFTTFVYAQGIPPANLPADSEYLAWAFKYAIGVALVAPPDMPAPLYSLAVYNLGMHRLVQIAQDIPPSTFFADLRKQFGLLTPVTGIVRDAGDQGTSASLELPQWVSQIGILGLQLIKTPWGAYYLEYAQAYGTGIVGVS